MASHRKGPAEHRYCVVQVRMYGDEKFKNLSKPQPNAQTLWCFLLHGHRTTRVPGVVIAGRGTLACDDLKWPLKAFDRCFQELVDAEMAVADWDAGLVYLVNAFKQPENKPASPPTAVTWRSELNSAPECPLLRRIVADLRAMLGTMGPAFLASFDAGRRADSGQPVQVGELAGELPTTDPTTPTTPASTTSATPLPREQAREQPSGIPSPAPSPAPSPRGSAPAHARSTALAVPARDPQAAPLAWKALREEAGERLDAGRPFPNTATGLPAALEADWLRAWQEARQVYTLDDLRKLGRALKARAVWDMARPLTAAQLVKRLPELLGQAVAWDGTPPAPAPARPASGQPPSPQEVAAINDRRRQEAIAQEEARRLKREEAERLAASPEEAHRLAQQALAALGDPEAPHGS